ncbi:putative metal-dependent hydrolase [Methanocella conradii HZ254]|uniref:Metal-dependent hydrolase n=1 Tax=Methanocella conradii (strain DSM 24694 / JCM 17849 / CGMCC 1.5162 / HZ254) TaxID=1041930 RepID=H8I8Z5_METCZ|nr:DHHA1 domain-containing protein [Methanocella conradii]AFD00466.1 putative metal-dependent hydrolase [Methanocella conradii HZ254]
MEQRLYCDSPYLEEWQAEVESIVEKGGRYHVVLSRTAFYPGGGGQPSDRGTIDGLAVEDVYEQDGHIYHVLGKPIEKKAVACRLDFSRRFDLMQQHTGQHLLSAVLYRLYGCKTSSLHMGEDELSIDVELPEMSGEMLIAVEDMANEYIYRDLPVVIHCVTAEEASKIELRKAPPKEGKVRIVEITSIDRSPCCGTHVKRTGEIGIVKIVKTEKRGNETRVYFKCGKRALKDYQLKQDIVTGLVRLYRMSESDVLAKAEAAFSQLKNVQKELAEMKDRALRAEATGLASSSKSRIIEKAYSDKSFADIIILAKYIIESGDFIVILGSIPDKRLLFAHSGKFGINCGQTLKEHLPAFKGKGGGKDNWANGGFNALDDMERFSAFLRDELSKKGIT